MRLWFWPQFHWNSKNCYQGCIWQEGWELSSPLFFDHWFWHCSYYCNQFNLLGSKFVVLYAEETVLVGQKVLAVYGSILLYCLVPYLVLRRLLEDIAPAWPRHCSSDQELEPKSWLLVWDPVTSSFLQGEAEASCKLNNMFKSWPWPITDIFGFTLTTKRI